MHLKGRSINDTVALVYFSVSGCHWWVTNSPASKLSLLDTPKNKTIITIIQKSPLFFNDVQVNTSERKCHIWHSVCEIIRLPQTLQHKHAMNAKQVFLKPHTNDYINEFRIVH